MDNRKPEDKASYEINEALHEIQQSFLAADVEKEFSQSKPLTVCKEETYEQEHPSFPAPTKKTISQEYISFHASTKGVTPISTVQSNRDAQTLTMTVSVYFL